MSVKLNQEQDILARVQCKPARLWSNTSSQEK